MPSTTNTLRPVTSADLLADSRKSEAEGEVGVIPQLDKPQYIIGPLGVLEDSMQITDSLIVAPAADFFKLLSDNTNVTDSLARSTAKSADYYVGGIGFLTYVGVPAYRGRRAFVSSTIGTCHGFLVKQPGVVGFAEVG